MRRSSTRSLANGAGNAAKRATVEGTDDAPLMQEADLSLYHDEKMQGIEHFQPYGFTSRVKAPTSNGGKKEKAEAVVIFAGQNSSHGIAVVIGDRRYRLKGLAEGEVALFDDLGQKVHLTRGGVVVETSLPVTIQSDVKVTLKAPKIILDGTVYLGGDEATATRPVSAIGTIASDGAVDVSNPLAKVFGT